MKLTPPTPQSHDPAAPQRVSRVRLWMMRHVRLPKIFRNPLEVLLDADILGVRAISKRRARWVDATMERELYQGMIAAGRAELAENKSNMANVLALIKPATMLEIFRTMDGIAAFSKPFGDYLGAFTMAATEGDVKTDAVLVEQLDADARLDDSEKMLLFEGRAEMSLRLLEAEMAGAIVTAEGES